MEEGNSRADSARGESFEAFEDVDPIREAAKARAEALRSRIAIVAGVAAITLGVALVAAPARESLRSDEESPTKPHASSTGTRPAHDAAVRSPHEAAPSTPHDAAASTSHEGGASSASIRSSSSDTTSSGAIAPRSSSSARAPRRDELLGVAPIPGASTLEWNTPSGWSELAPGPMRVASFRVAGDSNAECALVVLGGEGGGIGANVNRWRTQMGLGPLEPDAIEALPREPFLGGDAVFVDLRGTYTGMNASGAKPDARLVGLLRVAPGGSAFLKMTGPSSTLEHELENFRALAHSFRPKGSEDDALEAAIGGAPARLVWKAPEGWRAGPDRPTRVATYLIGEHGEAECYVTALQGESGGELANANRWRHQLGARAWSQAELDAQPRVNLLGADVARIEAEGPLEREHESPLDHALLLGAARTRPGTSIFVKLTGPADVVNEARAAFESFCATLDEVR